MMILDVSDAFAIDNNVEDEDSKWALNSAWDRNVSIQSLSLPLSCSWFDNIFTIVDVVVLRHCRCAVLYIPFVVLRS